MIRLLVYLQLVAIHGDIYSFQLSIQKYNNNPPTNSQTNPPINIDHKINAHINTIGTLMADYTQIHQLKSIPLPQDAEQQNQQWNTTKQNNITTITTQIESLIATKYAQEHTQQQASQQAQEQSRQQAQQQTLICHYQQQLVALNQHKYNPECDICLTNSNYIIVQKHDITAKLSKISKPLNNSPKISNNNQHQHIDQISNQISQLKTQRSTIIQSTNHQYTEYLAATKYNHEQSTKQETILSAIEHQLSQITILHAQQDRDINSQNDTYTQNIHTNHNKMLQIQIINKTIDLQVYQHNDAILTDKIAKCKLDIITTQTIISQTKKYKQQLDTIRKQKTFLSIYEKALNRDGLPKIILQTVLPNLQNNINKIIGNFCNFTVKIEMTNTDIDIYIIKRKQKLRIESCSGSEKFIIDMAIRIYLSKITKLSHPQFLVIDEGFTSFDIERLMAVKTIFAYLKTQYQFILVISHLEQLKGLFDKQYNIDTVEIDGSSKIMI